MSSQTSAWQKLDTLNRKLESLAHAESILRADEATNMPSGGGEKRAEAVSTIAGLYHEAASAPQIADWIAAAENEVESDEQRIALSEFKRAYTNLTCLPTEFVSRQTALGMRTEQMWRKKRGEGDWDGFAPALTEVLELAREEAQMRAGVLKLDPYDALMEQYDPGSRAAEVSDTFAKLKRFLTDFLPKALDAQDNRLAKAPMKPVKGPFSIDSQRELGLEMMKAIGFDFDHGRLDVSHHPFSGGVPTDVRMTTRYRSDEFLSSLMAVLHETGHSLYEQGLPREDSHWPSNKARGMGMHESQSLFNEMQIGRAEEFWQWGLPIVKKHIGAEIADWSVGDIQAHNLHVERSLIRVDADEVTYPLHVIMRFEIEQELIAGRTQVKDIPEVWDAKMTEYLGLRTIDDPANGPMQDVHWSFGAFGYFPSYTLGAMMAAQQMAALERDVPEARDLVARGEFEPINAWRREKIWRVASHYSTPETLERATGERLNAAHFEAHLTHRYLDA